PLLMQKEGLDARVMDLFRLQSKQTCDLEEWKEFLSRLKNPTDEVTIGLVGKYVELKDAYKSIAEAFIHAGAKNACKVNLKWIQSETINHDNASNILNKLDGVLVAPGFGERGVEGKIAAIRYVREHGIPFFGICLGMQCAVVEFARNVLKYEKAASTELYPHTPHPVIDMMAEQKAITIKGGTMRLGAYECDIKAGTLAHKAYESTKISERHRHRYEFNNKYINEFEAAGMQVSGVNPDGGLVEVVELKDHPWFVGAQFHPELKSTVLKPHPLFVGFINAAIEYSKHKVSNSIEV
ncbi:MAG TPA: CTP synthase, partial [Cytophagales bacterium]|nr:CTP synthase [Cytophagales bacterium]